MLPMDKVADFIVRKRALILGLMTVLVAICATFIPQVETNTDMTKYLPDSSPMKQGMALMEDEFPETEMTQTIRVMFNGLASEQADAIQRELEAIPHVDSVDYQSDSPDHNKDGHTLYIVNTTYDYGTPEEVSIEKALDSEFASYDMQWVTDNAEFDTLPAWAIPLALAILLVVLLSMSGSWLEPFLFLTSTGFAVLANMGTNIVFGSVSVITASIAAILQLILSMDYAIILMNRYRQERACEPNKTNAMKRAWRNAFSSIASSSTTTVLGLLAMVFLSLKIGADLGFVLAKGVLLSMVCTFTVLPGLILMFDALITKTAKKTPRLNMDRIGAFSYRARHVTVVLFAVLFVGAYIVQGHMNIVTSMPKEDPIAEVFAPANPVIVLYDNDDEQNMGEITKQLENNPHVSNVTSFASTLGKPLTASQMTDNLQDMSKQGSDMALSAAMDFDPALINLLYYDKLANGELHPIPVGAFFTFVSSDIANNEAFAGQIDEDMRAKLGQLEKFSDASTLTQPMKAEDLAQFFDMGVEDVKKLMVMYFTTMGGADVPTLTLPVFANFAANNVATDPTYAGMLDQNAASQLDMLCTFTDANAMTAPRGSAEIASLLGVDAQTVQLLFTYYYAQAPDFEPASATVSAFARFLANDVAAQPAFSGYLDEAAQAQLRMLAQLTNPEFTNKQMTSAELATTLGMDTSMVEQIMQVYYSMSQMPDGNPTPELPTQPAPAVRANNAAEPLTLSLEQLVNFLLAGDAENGGLTSQLDPAALQQLEFVRTITTASSMGTAFAYSELANLFGMDAASAKMLCTYYTALHGDTSSWALSMQAVVNFLVDNSSRFQGMLDAGSLSQLTIAQNLINGSVAGAAYSPQQLASLVGMDASQVNGLYLLYVSTYGDTSSWQLSVQDTVHFLADTSASSPSLADRTDLGTTDIQAAKTLVDAIASETPYTPEQLSLLMADAGQPMDQTELELLYLYHASTQHSDPAWTLSIEQLLRHLSENMVNDPRFQAFFDDGLRADIQSLQHDIDEAAAQLKGSDHSLMLINTALPIESAETTAFLEELTADLDQRASGNYYLMGSSVMGYEVLDSFSNEMLFITLLTAFVIFLVVAITFRSLIIPAILVSIVQCGIFLVFSILTLQGGGVYYLALLVLQCILMGATIDYGILLTTYYREKRKTLGVKDALIASYNGSIHTIATSGVIMILMTAIIGAVYPDPMMGQLCFALSEGFLCAITLILVVLPGMLAMFDRFVTKRASAQA